MAIILNKKLKPMGNTAYFLITSNDIIKYDLNVGEFYKFSIKGIGEFEVLLKLYGTSKVLQLNKDFFKKFTSLEKGKTYELSFTNFKSTNNTELEKNPSQFRELSSKIDKLQIKVTILEKKINEKLEKKADEKLQK